MQDIPHWRVGFNPGSSPTFSFFRCFWPCGHRKYRRQTNLEGLVYMYRGRTLAFSALISSELFSPAVAKAWAALRDE
jgi:hypothetical protein